MSVDVIRQKRKKEFFYQTKLFRGINTLGSSPEIATITTFCLLKICNFNNQLLIQINNLIECKASLNN